MNLFQMDNFIFNQIKNNNKYQQLNQTIQNSETFDEFVEQNIEIPIEELMDYWDEHQTSLV